MKIHDKNIDEILKKMKILYVEDEDVMRQNISSVLRMYCDNVKTSKNGFEGYNDYLQMDPDIVISDIEMVGMNGLELARKIRDRSSKCKIIITTAYADTDFLLQATELNLTKYLIKPISSEKLFEALGLAIKQMDDGLDDDMIKLDNTIFFKRIGRCVVVNGEEIPLTNNEFELFNELVRSNGNVVPKEILINAIWRKKEVGEESLRTLVKNLKKKIPSHIIKNVKGIGYVLYI